LSGPDIAAPLRHIGRRQRNVTVWMEEVTRIDVDARRVQAGTQTITYDYLVVATGSTHAYFGHDAWAAFAPGLKTMNDALAIRRRVLSAFEAAEREPDAERRKQWLTFVIVGAGPTGVELAGTLAEIAHHTLPREFRIAHPRDARIHLVEAGPRVLSAMPEKLSAIARRKLESMRVDVHTGAAVTGIDADGVRMGDEHIAARTVLWAAGVAASPLGSQLGGERDKAGRVKVAPDLSLPGHPDVFVIGDLAWVEQDGQRVPGMAPAAKQMGTYVAHVIRDRIAGRATRPFRYHDDGSLASISRSSAVVDLRGLEFSGFIGWLFWLFAHIFFLIGFRNRLAVMWNWAWSYLTWQRGARIIVGGRKYKD
jgi:NADH dehydrogenase